MTSYRSISPGLQEVRDYTIDVAMEIVRNYDIDGLHLDYVRWNEHTNTGRQSVGTNIQIPVANHQSLKQKSEEWME